MHYIAEQVLVLNPYNYPNALKLVFVQWRMIIRNVMHYIVEIECNIIFVCNEINVT